MKYIFLTFFSLLIIFEGKSDDLRTVDLVQAFDNVQEIFLSDFVESIEYIVLESHGAIRVHNSYITKTYSNDNFFISIDWRQICLFDRQTGKFNRTIGALGSDGFISAGFFDSNTQSVVANGSLTELVEYNLYGVQTRRIVKPPKEFLSIERFFETQFGSLRCRLIDDNTVAYYVNNTFGDAKERIQVADVNGSILKTFNNPNRFVREREDVASFRPPVFYQHDKNLFIFTESCVDTIFRVTKDSLMPHYHLKMGRYKRPCERLSNDQNFEFNNLGENEHFLFFNFSCCRDSFPSFDIFEKGHLVRPTIPPQKNFFGYYDKKSGTTRIAREGMIINDIDNFSAVQLVSWTINTERNELISIIHARDIVDWFEKNPEEAKNLPERLQKLSGLNSGDNPVVVVAKLK